MFMVININNNSLMNQSDRIVCKIQKNNIIKQ